jgi:hypothetical protein
MPAEPLRILIRVSKILDNLEIPYLTGGSVASSIFGVPRATQDIDLVIDLPLAKAKDFVKAMQPDFYIDSDAVTQAVQTRSSFNAIHFETVQKIDFFIRSQSDYASEEMRRRLKITVDETEQRTIFIASPEDIILQKLLWFRMGSGISERQWNDALGVIKVQSDRIDREYLTRWAKALDIADLVQKAFHDAGQFNS